MKAVRVRVTGVVQGVFFRQATARLCRDLDVTGWVRNLPDGSVEALFEGAAAAVDDMVRWCRTGPPGATVTALDARPEVPRGRAGFEVR